MNINANQLIQQLSADLSEVIEEVNKRVNSVEELEHLNLPEADRKWSMLQCIAHMTLAAKIYVENTDKAFANHEQRDSNYEFRSHWRSDWFTNRIAPDANAIIKNRIRTMKSMYPKEVLDKDQTLADFNELHHKMLQQLETARNYDLNRIKISSALGPILKFRLGDGFRFVIAHAQRHIVQLKRIHQNLPEIV